MRIPGIDTQPDVPPPLPPPRFPLGNNMAPNHPVALRRHDFQSSLSSFGSGYGSGYGSIEDSDRFRRKDLRHPVKDDEGYQSWSSEPRYDLVLAL